MSSEKWARIVTWPKIPFWRSTRPLPSPTSSQIVKLNDSVYQLFKPDGEPTVQILFFHGLQFASSSDAYLSTWTSGDASHQVWPGTWLVEDFPTAQIFSISYDSSMKKSREDGRLDLFRTTENLMHAIGWEKVGQVRNCPVVLVGHSFGGLVIKQLCLQAHKNHNLRDFEAMGSFLNNLRGVFFYGTPHHGTSLADIAGHLLDGPLLEFAKLLDADAARLHEDFDALRKKYKKWKASGVGEARPTKFGPFEGKVVSEGSARYGERFCIIGEDHISICKPKDKTSNSFKHLTEFIEAIVGQEDETHFENKQILPKFAVGLDIAVEEVERQFGPKVKSLGIGGMGGIGKTTLAKAIFNKLAPKYDYTCFVPNVKNLKKPVEDVKREVRSCMHFRGSKLRENEGDWLDLRGRRFFLVLDDFGDDDHALEEILATFDGYGVVDSHYIVTSRNLELLNCLDYVFKVSFLSVESAKKLFLSHAFPNDGEPPPTLERHVNAIVAKCDGLPLTLEVLGKYLKGKGTRESGKLWEQSLEALEKADAVGDLEKKVWEKLKVSYSGLENPEQQMFLDAAFFCNFGLCVYEAKAVWSRNYGLEEIRWKTLVTRSLVYDVEDGDEIRMHEHLRDLGERIASADGKNGSRIWPSEKALKLLQSTEEADDGGEEVVALRLSDYWRPSVALPSVAASAFCRFKKLQYLYLADVDIIKDGEDNLLPANLVLLYLRGPWFPSSLAGLNRLAVLDLYGVSWTCFPRSLGQLSGLKILRIESADDLESMPETFGQLLQLEILELSQWTRLATIPEALGNLLRLRRLTIEDCENLQTLPESFGLLYALKYVAFSGLDSLRCLPESFGQLAQLEYLKIRHCFSLEKLPESLAHLASLNHLIIDMAPLKCLPDSLQNLPSLRVVELCALPSLAELPLWLRNFKAGEKALNPPQWLENNPSQVWKTLCAWFGDVGPLRMSRTILHTQDGHVTFSKETKMRGFEWRRFLVLMHREVMKKVRVSNYGGALQDLDALDAATILAREYDGDYQGALMDLRYVDFYGDPFQLQERGILKRLVGDLDGALADLTSALELDGEDYECRKHRSYVKYLMGDLEGAQIDAERAVEIKPADVDDHDYAYEDFGEGRWLTFLGGLPIEFLAFTLK